MNKGLKEEGKPMGKKTCVACKGTGQVDNPSPHLVQCCKCDGQTSTSSLTAYRVLEKKREIYGVYWDHHYDSFIRPVELAMTSGLQNTSHTLKKL